MTTNIQSNFCHASVRNGRWHVPRMALKAQMTVGGDVLDKESVGTNEESGMLLFIVHFLLYSCV